MARKPQVRSQRKTRTSQQWVAPRPRGSRTSEVSPLSCPTRSCRRTDSRLAIVGDVHGDAVRLARMLRSVIGDNRQVVLVGDYVNRGANSKAVLSMLVEAKRQLGLRLVLLAGNHDMAMLQYIDGG